MLSSGPRFDLVLIDYAMPGMNGGELAGRVRARDADQKIVFITGYADFTALAALGEDRVVQKPYHDGELAQEVAAALGQPQIGNVTPLRRGQASRSSE